MGVDRLESRTEGVPTREDASVDKVLRSLCGWALHLSLTHCDCLQYSLVLYESVVSSIEVDLGNDLWAVEEEEGVASVDVTHKLALQHARELRLAEVWRPESLNLKR